jgi:hypothetical protein
MQQAECQRAAGSPRQACRGFFAGNVRMILVRRSSEQHGWRMLTCHTFAPSLEISNISAHSCCVRAHIGQRRAARKWQEIRQGRRKIRRCDKNVRAGDQRP